MLLHVQNYYLMLTFCNDQFEYFYEDSFRTQNTIGNDDIFNILCAESSDVVTFVSINFKSLLWK